MARVIVSREARNDLVSIRDYIRDELEHHPGRGKPLDALIAVHTEYRYLICENYCVFYVCMESTVLVVRILHQRQDSFRALFLSE